ncbi:hypothetical protein BpHYR1_048158, partial [Brachionus plicatilis]
LTKSKYNRKIGNYNDIKRKWFRMGIICELRFHYIIRHVMSKYVQVQQENWKLQRHQSLCHLVHQNRAHQRPKICKSTKPAENLCYNKDGYYPDIKSG